MDAPPMTLESNDAQPARSHAAHGSVHLPDCEGTWLHEPTGEQIEIYRLEPAGGQLCFWGPDIGITYSGAQETQGIWESDEWQGHIMVQFYDDVGPWRRIAPNSV